MKQNKHNQQEDLLKVVENVQEFLESYQGVNELYKRACKAMSILMYLQRKFQPDELEEVAACTGASHATVKRVLDDLCKRKLIIKKEVIIDKVRYCHYKAADEVVYVKKMGNCTVVTKC